MGSDALLEKHKPFRHRNRILEIIIPNKPNITLIGICLGVVFFYLCDWQLLIDITTKTTVFVLKVLGYQIWNCKNVIYIANHQGIQITAFCTYVDWLLIAIPLVSSYSKYFWKNCLAVVILVMIWFPVNIIRICFTIDMSSRGYGWWLSHDLLYYVLWFFSLFVIIVFWFKKSVRVKSGKLKMFARKPGKPGTGKQETVEQPTRPQSNGRESRRANCPISGT